MVDINLYGDGTSTLVMINLTKSPFSLTFSNFFPSAISFSTSMGQEPSSIQLVQSSTLRVEYSQPLENYDPVAMTPRHKISVQLLYG